MKNHFAVLSITVAAICTVPWQIMAEDAVPPKPPGGSSAPAAAPSATPAPSSPQGGGPGGRVSPEERLKRMTEMLGLSQDQQDKIKAIMEKYGPQMRELISKGRDNLTADDKTKLGELFKSQTEEIAAVLTPEQKEKYKEAMEKRRGAGGGPGAPGGAAPQGNGSK